MARLSSSFFFSVLFATSSLAATLQYNFNVGNAVLAPDGFSRSMSVVNGQFPGPLLTGQKGDTLMVTVNNTLSDPTMRQSTSIHWHGLTQNENNQNDGPAFVTQCPISPAHSYTYQVNFGNQTGTYWYHSHLSTQYVDGVVGPIVIYDPEDPLQSLYDVDDESTIIAIGTVHHTSAKGLTNIYKAGGAEPVPDAAVINGKGRYVGGDNVDFAVLPVTANTRYRFRLINMSDGATFTCQFAGHNMTIIEADGVETQSLTVDNLPIVVGQRYSVVVETNQPVDNYWLNCPVTGGVTGTNSTFDPTMNRAVLRYEGAPIAEPTAAPATPGGVTAIPNTQLKPLDPTPVPGGDGPADTTIVLNVGRATVNGSTVWSFNNKAWTHRGTPTLLEVLTMGYESDSDFSPDEDAFVVQPNTVIQLNISAHPIHLHGHTFHILSAGGSPINTVDPPIRDVVDATKGAVVRFQTDNPGAWFVHCHIEWHLESGLAAVIVESPDQERAKIQPDDDWNQLCPLYNALPPEQQ